jgi:predicted AAA+ superfamily ATPase
LIGARPEVQQVVIDEVQKLPVLLEVVQLLIEDKQGVQFIFTGSSARKLRRGGVNLLGGRAAQKSLYPFGCCIVGGSDFCVTVSCACPARNSCFN